MNAQQFATFMQGFTNAMTAFTAAAAALATPSPGPTPPKISVKILTYKGESKENVVVWLLQVRNLFRAQGINDNATRIYYAASELEGAALYWYINKIQVAGNNAAFTGWNDFMNQLKGAFQPPTINNISGNNSNN